MLGFARRESNGRDAGQPRQLGTGLEKAPSEAGCWDGHGQSECWCLKVQICPLLHRAPSSHLPHPR